MDGSRFFFAEDVMRRRRVYSTNVGRFPHSDSSRRSPSDTRERTSAMFCMEVSRRPPLVPSSVAGLDRFTSIPGNAPAGGGEQRVAHLLQTDVQDVGVGWIAAFRASWRHGLVRDAVLREDGVLDIGDAVGVIARASRRSMSTLTPSDAPRCRSQLAKPIALSSLAPTPESARMVVSVPAMGLVIWRTVAPFRPLAASQVKTPLSCMSFQMAPCPPGLSAMASSPSLSGTHAPPRGRHHGDQGLLEQPESLLPATEPSVVFHQFRDAARGCPSPPTSSPRPASRAASRSPCSTATRAR